MDYHDTMATLEVAGTAQNRKTYARHGIGEPLFGVSHAVLGKLAKQIKCDHALARQLWQSGVYDACVLATMIADPEQMAVKDLDAWAKGLHNYALADAFAKLVARTKHAANQAQQWLGARDEWIATVGWILFAILCAPEHGMAEAELAARIPVIERDIHAAKNRVRYAMNNALVAIGLRSAALEKAAIAAAKRIGPVQVDHGQTGCKTPDAASYIAKGRAYQNAKASKRKAGANPTRLVPRAKPAAANALGRSDERSANRG